MQNSKSNPSLGPRQASDISNGFTVPQPRTSGSSKSSRTRPRHDINNSETSSRGDPSALLSCITPLRDSAPGRKEPGEKHLRLDGAWLDANFPRQGASRRNWSCVSPLEERGVSAETRLIGRQVAPHQFILSFRRAPGGVSYTVGALAGGRGFFAHPGSVTRPSADLKVISAGQRAADERRRRHLDGKVQRAREMAIRRHPIPPKPSPSLEKLPIVPESATRATSDEFLEIPLWEENERDITTGVEAKKAIKTKRKRLDKAVWHKVANFFAGKPMAHCGAQLSSIQLLENDETRRVASETMSLPGRAASKPGSRKRSKKCRSQSRDGARLRDTTQHLAETS